MSAKTIDIVLRLQDQSGSTIAAITGKLKGAEDSAKKVGKSLGDGLEAGARRGKSAVETTIQGMQRWLGMGAAVWGIGNRMVSVWQNAHAIADKRLGEDAQERYKAASDAYKQLARVREDMLRSLSEAERTFQTSDVLRMSGADPTKASAMAAGLTSPDQHAFAQNAAKAMGRLGLSTDDTTAAIQRLIDGYKEFGHLPNYGDRLLALADTKGLAGRKDLASLAAGTLLKGARMSGEAEQQMLDRLRGGGMKSWEIAALLPDTTRYAAGPGRMTLEEWDKAGNRTSSVHREDWNPAYAGKDAWINDPKAADWRDRLRQFREARMPEAPSAPPSTDGQGVPTARDWLQAVATEAGPIIGAAIVMGVAQAMAGKALGSLLNRMGQGGAGLPGLPDGTGPGGTGPKSAPAGGAASWLGRAKPWLLRGAAAAAVTGLVADLAIESATTDEPMHAGSAERMRKQLATNPGANPVEGLLREIAKNTSATAAAVKTAPTTGGGE